MRLSPFEIERQWPGVFGWREQLTGGPDWLRWPLVSTEAAREKARAWFTDTPRPWSALDPADVLTRISFVGDEVWPHTLSRVLCELPRPVADYMLRTVTFIGLLQVEGFCSAPVSYGDRPWLVVLGPADRTRESLRALAAHEVSHCWLMQEPAPGSVASTAFRQSVIHDTPFSEIPEHVRAEVQRRRAQMARDERQAEALVRSWGY